MNRLTDVQDTGSSPRVRGKQQCTPSTAQAPGLIPACAGKTDLVALQRVLGQAHPRVCGENSLSRGRLSRACGSSPRVRGKLGPEM